MTSLWSQPRHRWWVQNWRVLKKILHCSIPIKGSEVADPVVCRVTQVVPISNCKEITIGSGAGRMGHFMFMLDHVQTGTCVHVCITLLPTFLISPSFSFLCYSGPSPIRDELLRDLKGRLQGGRDCLLTLFLSRDAQDLTDAPH